MANTVDLRETMLALDERASCYLHDSNNGRL